MAFCDGQVCLPPTHRLQMARMCTPSHAVSTYILAKDGNRPFLMRRVFAEDAELEIVVNTDAISFPSSAKGVSAIEDILVRRFGLDCENVYTFCLSQPSEANRRHFPCHWLVGNSATTVKYESAVGVTTGILRRTKIVASKGSSLSSML